MKVAGIVAEYNPLHKGHEYHIRASREAIGADYVVVALSGDFVQRGAPAFLDKMLRAKAALLCGADLVVEIPTVYATSSAEGYALGSAATLDALGCIDNICFGMEANYTEDLELLASKVRNCKAQIKDSVNNEFKEGGTYASAFSEMLSDEENLTPNNILAIEYINALFNLSSPIRAKGIKRLGDYSSDVLADEESGYSSASALRKAYLESGSESFLNHVPEATRPLYESSLKTYGPLSFNDFSSELRYKLSLESATGYEKYLGIDRSLSDRIANLSKNFSDWSSFIDLVKTRNLTYTHVSRALLHILLDIRKEDYTELSRKSSLPYVHVLGFREDATPLLKEIKEKKKAEIIYTAEDAKNVLVSDFCRLLNIDLISARIYNGKLKEKYGVEISADFASPVLKV